MKTYVPTKNTIAEQKIKNIINMMQIENIENCRNCDFAYFCAGDCRGEVLAAGKDIGATHPKCETIKKYLIEMMFDLSEDATII